MTWIIDRWYVIAWDGEGDRTPIARTICDLPVTLYRKLNREIVAMRDACPHRLLPLSMGRREGGSIRCRYHGLKSGPAGIAEEMPLNTERVNRSICVETYSDIGGVRARQLIERARRATRPSAEEIAA